METHSGWVLCSLLDKAVAGLVFLVMVIIGHLIRSRVPTVGLPLVKNLPAMQDKPLPDANLLVLIVFHRA